MPPLSVLFEVQEEPKRLILIHDRNSYICEIHGTEGYAAGPELISCCTTLLHISVTLHGGKHSQESKRRASKYSTAVLMGVGGTP